MSAVRMTVGSGSAAGRLRVMHVVPNFPWSGQASEASCVLRALSEHHRESADLSIYSQKAEDMTGIASVRTEEIELPKPFGGPVRIIQVNRSGVIPEGVNAFVVDDPVKAPESDLSRWARFNIAVLEHMRKGTMLPDIIHCHEQGSGLIPLFLSLQQAESRKIGVIFSPYVHTDPALYPMAQWAATGLPDEVIKNFDIVEYNEKGSLLKAGFMAAKRGFGFVLFPTMTRLMHSLSNDPSNPQGFPEFIQAIRQKGGVHSVLTTEADLTNGEVLLNFARELTKTYRSLAYQLSGHITTTVAESSAAYDHLTPESRAIAEQHFRLMPPHLAWMEQRFLQIVDMVATGRTVSAVPASQIEAVDPKNSEYFDDYRDFKRMEDRYREIGEEAIERGELMAIDLVAGMATGFGGGAKASVNALVDVRYEKVEGKDRGVTYLDIKRANYLAMQRDAKRHFIAAAMVSEETESDVVENLERFAKAHKVKLVIIPDGASRAEIEEVWRKNKDDWDGTIIVPLIKQPSCRFVSKDGKSVGPEYMKGHGDFYDVVKSQLKDIMDVMGIKYVFSSNIDNSGALMSRTILGYFTEQVKKGYQAIMEAAEKYEGDKGGVPAKVNGQFTVLEGSFVPDEWKDRFNGRDVFPYFNTNSFWFTKEALMDTKFNLPLMISGAVNDTWLKVESIMGHGLANLKWKALVVDRGLRFLPAKFLTDLWIMRTDWIRWFRNRLIPVMHDGSYVPKPIVEVSKKIFGKVSDVGDHLFAHGAYDSMQNASTIVIGGEGRYFDELGELKTQCAVRYEGDVSIIYEHRKGQASGSLVIKGNSERDEITLKNCVIFVPAGEQVVINSSRIGVVDESVTRADFEAFIDKAGGKRWTSEQRSRVLEKFFPSTKPIPILEGYFTESYLKNLTEISRENARALLRVFQATGSFKYQVTNEKGMVRIKVANGSKSGEAVHYQSRAEEKAVIPSSDKVIVISEGNRIYLNSGDERSFVGIPIIQDGKTVALHMVLGRYDETYPSEEKHRLLKGKLAQVIDILEKRNIREIGAVLKLFSSFSWKNLLECTASEIAAQIAKKIA